MIQEDGYAAHILDLKRGERARCVARADGIVNLYILAQQSFEKFKHGEEKFIPIREAQCVMNGMLEFKAPVEGRRYFLVVNASRSELQVDVLIKIG